MNNFEYASKNFLRINVPGSILTTEDLWALPLKTKTAKYRDLNSVAKHLHGQLGEEELDFVGTTSSKNKALEVAFEIVKHIIASKKADQAASLQALELKEKEQKLLAKIAVKEDEVDDGKTIEELRAELVDVKAKKAAA